MRGLPAPARAARRSIPRLALQLLFRTGLLDVFHALNPRRLTVFAYHRIDDPFRAGFDTFAPNVSATPQEFARHMDYVARRFNVIGVEELAAWLMGHATLPRYPALITFDDGYADNLHQAFPILQARRLPAIIFLATDYIGGRAPFYWDLVAYCFKHTQQDSVDLPLQGLRHWSDVASRDAVMMNWIATLKTMSDTKKESAVVELPERLSVSVPDDAFAGLCLTWDEVRSLASAGIAMGAHTMRHPILTRIPIERARKELEGSRQRIEAEIGKPVVSLAYPNGLTSDFSSEIQNLAREVGFAMAFTLLGGPDPWQQVRAAPMAIRRVYVGLEDILPRFGAKASGFARLIRRG